MRDEFCWFDGRGEETTEGLEWSPEILPDMLPFNFLLIDELPESSKASADELAPRRGENESWTFDYGAPSLRSKPLNPELYQLANVRSYDSMRMPLRPKHSMHLSSRLPPRHIMEAYERSKEERPTCEECGRAEDDDGMIVHEGFCSQYGPCPRCGSTNKSAEGFGAYVSHCNDCGYDVSLL